MKNFLEKLLATILFGIIYGFIIKYTNTDVAIICLLMQIYLELIFRK